MRGARRSFLRLNATSLWFRRSVYEIILRWTFALYSVTCIAVTNTPTSLSKLVIGPTFPLLAPKQTKLGQIHNNKKTKVGKNETNVKRKLTGRRLEVSAIGVSTSIIERILALIHNKSCKSTWNREAREKQGESEISRQKKSE